MEKLAERLTKYVLLQGAIKEEDYAIYKYGFQTGMELSLCIIVCLILAIFMGRVFECVLLMLSFFSQRAYVEGIHLKHFYSCFLLSCGVIIGGLKLLEFNRIHNIAMLVVVLVCLFGIYRLAIMNSAEIEDDEVGKFFSRQRRRVMWLIGSIAMLFCLINYDVGLFVTFYTEIVLLLSTFLKVIVNKFVSKLL